MKILFLARHQGYFRSYESVIRMLAGRGHQVHLSVERADQVGGEAVVWSLTSECSGVTFGQAPSRPDDEWAWVVGRLRLGLDYLRYQHPVFDRAYKLKARARERTPGLFVRLAEWLRALGGWAGAMGVSVVRRLERAVPEDPGIRGYFEALSPDLLLVTPLIDLGSAQIEYLRVARTKGVPTALCVWSWDHLSSKALIREAPDRVFVWNATQKDEAVRLHGVPPERVVVTGAQCFDHWFERQPSRERSEFCTSLGLNPSKPLISYVCSALFAGSPSEALFVARWVMALRHAEEPLRTANVLVRPHPSRLAEWQEVDTRALGIVLWGRSPVDAQSRADYFDSLYHADAVVGLNTSAMIEAGILGRPVLTVIVPEFAENQTGTVHFEYLSSVGGGLVTAATSLEQHAQQLAAVVKRPASPSTQFVSEFVRPRGLDVPATPYFVEQVEALGVERPEHVPASTGGLATWFVRQLSRAQGVERLEGWTLSWRERDSAEHGRDELRRKALVRAEARARSDASRVAALRQRAADFERLVGVRRATRQRIEARYRARDEARAGGRSH